MKPSATNLLTQAFCLRVANNRSTLRLQQLAGGSVQEEWRSIFGWEQWYEISNHGRLRRIAYAQHRNRVMSPSPNSDGYLSTMLSRPDRRQCVGIHRLVAAAFIGKCPRGMEVNHIDGVKTNNAAWNLEFVTSRRQKIHALALGLWHTKVTPEIVRTIRAESLHLTQKAIGMKYGIDQSTVSRIVNGHRWNWLDEVA
jgi:hypothetical protein